MTEHSLSLSMKSSSRLTGGVSLRAGSSLMALDGSGLDAMLLLLLLLGVGWVNAFVDR